MWSSPVCAEAARGTVSVNDASIPKEATLDGMEAVPCDVLTGLTAADGVDLAVTCRRSRRAGNARVDGDANSSTP
jgi:hypothetical protein